MYSLVNVATLVRDLARLPTAKRTVRDLLRAFALDDDALVQLDALALPATESELRHRALRMEQVRPRALSVLTAARGLADDLGLDAYVAASEVLDQATMFGPEELTRFIRHDVLERAWSTYDDLAVARFPRALDVVADGVVAGWCDDDRLGGPWRRWVATTQAPLAWPVATPALDAVRALPREAQFTPAPAEWASHVHEACWASHLTGRLRDAAIAQLHALHVVLDVYAPAAPPLRAVAGVVAAVHADLARDLLDAATYDAMTQPLFRLVS